NVAADELDTALAAFSRIALDDPVTAEAGPTLARFGHRVLHLPVQGLDGLAAATVAATASVGAPPEDRPFAGHLTLARAKGRGRPSVDLSPFTSVRLSATWAVREVTLVRSTPGAGGSRYEVIASVGVGGREGP